MFMVSVPGLNDWAIDIQKKRCGTINNVADNTTNDTSNGIKRQLEPTVEQMEEDTPSNETNMNKQAKCSSNIQNDGFVGLSREYLLNSPIPDRPSKTCLVKFYENFDDISLNSVLDIIGFLSIDPSLCGSLQQESDNDLMSQEERCAMHPPPSLVPRIHVISMNTVNTINPMHEFVTETPLIENQIVDIYKDLILILTQCLFGDALAAEYFLCHLISNVYVRGDETLGQFSINITNIPAEVLPTYTKQLYEVISLLLPASHYLPVTLENLNTLEYNPR